MPDADAEKHGVRHLRSSESRRAVGEGHNAPRTQHTASKHSPSRSKREAELLVPNHGETNDNSRTENRRRPRLGPGIVAGHASSATGSRPTLRPRFAPRETNHRFSSVSELALWRKSDRAPDCEFGNSQSRSSIVSCSLLQQNQIGDRCPEKDSEHRLIVVARRFRRSTTCWEISSLPSADARPLPRYLRLPSLS